MYRTAALLCCLALTVPLTAQERQKKLTTEDVPTLLDKAGKQFAADDLQPCLDTLNKAIQAVRAAMRKLLAAAMPEVDGMVKEEIDDDGQAAAMGLGYGINVPFQQEYRAEDGDGSLRIAVHDSSPTVKMIEMAINMAAMQKDAEVIKYGAHKALFKKENDGQRFAMQLVLAGKHLIDIAAEGMTEDAFFKVFSQAWVDKIAALLGT